MRRNGFQKISFLFFIFLVRFVLADNVLAPPPNGMYAGVFTSYDESVPAFSTALTEYVASAGKGVVWDIVFSEWGSDLKFPKALAQAVHELGATPFIRILPRSVPDQTSKIDPVLRLDFILRGDFDAQIRAWADGARDFGFPFLAEFGPEANGFWNQWGGIHYQNGPALYAAVYRRVVKICREQKATNITWFFHPNGEDNPRQANNKMSQFYPGDDVIDWLGVSVLGAQNQGDFWDQFVDVMDAAYAEVSAISPSKPIALVETGVIEDLKGPNHKAQWLKDAFRVLKANRYPRLKAYSYWNEVSWQPEGNDLRVTSSPATLSAFRTGIMDSFFMAVPVWSGR